MEYFIKIIRPSQSFLLFWFGSGQGSWLCGGMYMYYYNHIRLHSNNLLLHKKKLSSIWIYGTWFESLISVPDFFFRLQSSRSISFSDLSPRYDMELPDFIRQKKERLAPEQR